MSVQNTLTKTQHNADDMELINRQNLKKLCSKDVFTFSVILCDNELDCDFEVFSEQSLRSLEWLFVGKTGVLSFSNRSEANSARIYKTQLIAVTDRKTSYGDDYKCLKAWCYMVKSSENIDLIKSIENGEKTEVSISCSVPEVVCSICGKPIRGNEIACNHRKGKFYDGKLCYRILVDVAEAYEWNF